MVIRLQKKVTEGEIDKKTANEYIKIVHSIYEDKIDNQAETEEIDDIRGL